MDASLRLAAALALAALAACRTPLPDDPDALPADAVPLPLARVWSDSLECARNDCTDWFRIDVAGRGDLRIEVEPAAAEQDAVAVRGALLDPNGDTLAEVSPDAGRGGIPEIQLRSDVKRGSYRFAVSSGEARAHIDYRLTARFEPEPPPPPPPPPPRAVPPAPRPPPAPRFESKRSAVLEVEGARAGARTVLLELGRADGMKIGLRGRLVESGTPIGDIEIVEVFPEGSRARIAAELRGAIGPATIAEIQVPLEPRAPARRRR